MKLPHQNTHFVSFSSKSVPHAVAENNTVNQTFWQSSNSQTGINKVLFFSFFNSKPELIEQGTNVHICLETILKWERKWNNGDKTWNTRLRDTKNKIDDTKIEKKKRSIAREKDRKRKYEQEFKKGPLSKQTSEEAL